MPSLIYFGTSSSSYSAHAEALGSLLILTTRLPEPKLVKPESLVCSAVRQMHGKIPVAGFPADVTGTGREVC